MTMQDFTTLVQAEMEHRRLQSKFNDRTENEVQRIIADFTRTLRREKRRQNRKK
jgi:hypothetical protein